MIQAFLSIFTNSLSKGIFVILKKTKEGFSLRYYWYMNQRLLFFFLFFLGPGVCVLLSRDRPEFSNIQYFTSDEGLSQSEVTCILQDRQGFLWIGTRGGLNRYDGYSFQIFQNEIGNPNSLINNSIECLLEDRQGNIWIGTKSNGLSKYSPELEQFEHFLGPVH